MQVRRYRGRHLKPRPKKHGPVVFVTAASVSLTPSAAAAKSYVVQAGDTLSELAARHGTTVTALADLNDLADPNHIVIGTRLRISGPSRSTHVVQGGETLSGIATRYRTTVAHLARINRIRDRNFIVVGQKLRVPGPGPARIAPTPRSSIEASLVEQSRLHGVDPALTKAVAWQESGWRQDVVSSAGAIGVMQVIPDTARFVNRVLGGGKLKVRRADDNVHLGVMYLRHLQATMGTTRKALAGYFAGPGAVGKRLNRIQRAYVRNVVALRKRFK